MNYPSLSLKQNLIDEVFSGLKYGTEKQLQQTSPSRQKMHDKIQKDLRLQRGLVEDCDQCEYKTSKFKAMYRHKRENHLVLKQKCTDCDYSHIYPNRVKKHFNQVHRGIQRRRHERCRSEECEFAGTQNCSELQNHSLFFCTKCELSFKRSDDLKFHNEKVHEGLFYSCDYCDSYSTARKSDLRRHIICKHLDDGSKQSRKQKRAPRCCKEEECTFVTVSSGQLKRHIVTKHEGIIRFKCYVMNCTFRSSEHKNLRRHNLTHEKVTTCDQVGCDVKVKNMSDMKMHIAVTHEGGIKYTCELENCNFETHLKKYLVKHTRRCKYVTNSDSVHMNTSSREETQ